MSLDYAARILLDSVAPCGTRLITYEITFPRLILAEFNAHRILSRNSASSRAIPPELQIERLLTAPYVPNFGTRVKGMGSGELNPRQLECVEAWLEARDAAVATANKLIELDADKARINRLLEPFMWHTVIVTGTEWENFLGLRMHSDAQWEFQIIARMMQDAMNVSVPAELAYGDWHTPMVTDADDEPLLIYSNQYARPMLSAGRCARVSFDTQHRIEEIERSIVRAVGLTSSAHWSPTEHQAKVLPVEQASRFNGNFRPGSCWAQFRKMFLAESNFYLLSEYGNDMVAGDLYQLEFLL